MPQQLLVERALALIPPADEFLPLSDAVIGTSHADRGKLWAKSNDYATLGKRVVDPARLRARIPALAARVQQRLEELYSLVLDAIEAQQAGDLAGAALKLVQAGELEEAERRFERADAIYALALELAQHLREKEPQILALRRRGRVARAAGRLDDAWTWYDQSYQLSLDQMQIPGQVIACQGLGNVCDARGERHRARAWYERGLKLGHGLNEPALTWPFFTNLSVIAMLDGRLAEARALLGTARDQIERTGDPGAMLYWYNNRGLLLLENGDAEAAEAVFREALPRAADAFWQLTLRTNLGQALLRQARLFEAEAQAREAEELAIVHQLIADLVDVYTLRGAICEARGDEEGFVFFEQALAVCRQQKLPPVAEARVYHGYGTLYLRCGRAAEGEAYLRHAETVYQRLGLETELRRVRAELPAAAVVVEG